MGDGADLAIEQGMAEDDYRYDHPEEFEDENCDYSPASKFHYTKYKVCRCCGVGGLHWGMTPRRKWMLADSENKTHQCKVNPYKKIKYEFSRILG